MINFKEELRRFKPSMDVDDIEDAITKMDLTDMNDIMFQMMEKASAVQIKNQTAQQMDIERQNTEDQ